MIALSNKLSLKSKTNSIKENVASFNKQRQLRRTYSIPKHKRISKWWSICSSFSDTLVCVSRVVSNTVNKLLWNLLEASHFNLICSNDMIGGLDAFNQGTVAREDVVTSSFDVKKMFVVLPHSSIMRAVEWFVDIYEENKVLDIFVKRRGKGVVLGKRKNPPTRFLCVKLSTIVTMVNFDLDNTFVSAMGLILQQKVGIPMRKSYSLALAYLLCAFNEAEFLNHLGRERRMLFDMRLVDDVSIFSKF